MGVGAAFGGLSAARPDQLTFPPPAAIVPGSRGPLRAREVIVSGSGPGSGIFVYSPTVALGNLIASITSYAGSGPKGEAV